ncbi:MAG: PEGA domain-containing protein [Treponema sp.]|nr:PEGA domain-containing protein [Treponema sp.]
MCRRRIFCLPLLFFCTLFTLYAASNVSNIIGDNFEETDGRGLVINTNPRGVRVFIDGIERTQTPARFDRLRPGEYNIRLSKDGYKDRYFRVTISNNNRLTVSIEMEEARGQALVSVHRAAGSPDSLPCIPQVFAGSAEGRESIISRPTGENMVMISLPVGYRTIRVRAFGWEDATTTALITEDRTTSVNIELKPAEFRLEKASQSRSRFNPKNSSNLGINEYRFEATAPGTGTLTITDKNGFVVYESALGPFSSWFQSASWNGRDIYGDVLPEGIYTALIEIAVDQEFYPDTTEPQIIKLETEISYSINIFPLSLYTGFSGLAFTPAPHVLPAGSFQIEGGILFGKFNSREDAFSRLPFEAGLRFSFLDRLEIAAVLNANPHFDGSAEWGFAGSAKYSILGGDNNLPLALAAGAGYAWAEDTEASPGLNRGALLYLPLSLELTKFSFIFSPGMRWPGPEDPVPRLELSAGALYRRAWLNAGLSVNSEFDFSDMQKDILFNDRVMITTGADVRFYPPPSNLVFSFLAGAWFRGSDNGAFGGLGIGVIY